MSIKHGQGRDSAFVNEVAQVATRCTALRLTAQSEELHRSIRRRPSGRRRRDGASRRSRMLQIAPQALQRTYTIGADRNIVPASVA